MTKTLLRSIGVLIFSANTFSTVAFGQQTADPNFQPKVGRPTFTKKRPKVLFDEAHYNFHTAGGRYKPFAELITADGYQVVSNKEKFSKALLQAYDILVIANALGEERGLSAFTEDECNAVRDWVKAGGCLLLVADHAPFGAAAKDLSMRFGVNMSTAHTATQRIMTRQHPGSLGRSSSHE